MIILVFPTFLIPVKCFSQKKITRIKNIPYLSGPHYHPKKHILDLYYRNDGKENKQVFIFIHGGGWRIGNKNRYSFLAKRMAEKGKVTILINYRLSGKLSYRDRAEDCASAFSWVQKNIDGFGGDSAAIFLSGHSAGAHLAALIALDTTYFRKTKLKQPVKGVFLIDPFGLNMSSFFRDRRYRFTYPFFYPTFSRDTTQWQAGSPVIHIHRGQVPFLVAVGRRTIKCIRETSKAFVSEYNRAGNKATLVEVKGKKHIGMIWMFHNRRHPLYESLLKFMESE